MALFRTWMFVPGSDSDKLFNAPQYASDALIFDLEDAVAEADKETARLKVKAALCAIADRTRSYVRVNAASSRFFEDDVALMVDRHLGGIMLPKAESAEHIRRTDERIARLERECGAADGSVEIVPMIETALGLYRSYDIASASPRVRRLAFGSLDFCRDVRAVPSEEGGELLYARSMLVVHSRAAGIEAPIDTVFPRVRDEEGLIRETRLARQLGFQGKLVIHPAQIDPVRAVFRPSADEISQAEAVVAAYEEAVRRGAAAVLVDGSMVDLPVVERARTILLAREETE